MNIESMSNEKIVSIFEMFGPIAGSRIKGAELREDISNLISDGFKVKLDFDNVRTINASFSDEVIAKLVTELGLQEFNKFVKMSHANNSIKSVINFVVSSRLKKQA